jgi:chromosomal replication initiation ATPase DnaA
MMQQIFQFEERHDYLPENFLVSTSNKAAFDAIAMQSALNIYGPKASGKTYLAHLAKDFAVWEDVNAATNQPELLAFLNSAREHGQKVLLTSQIPVTQIAFILPDLKSRLAALNLVGLDEPDDGLIYMLLARHFAARQLKVSDDVISFVASRTSRSFEAVHNSIEKIDNLALTNKKNVSINLVKNLYAS